MPHTRQIQPLLPVRRCIRWSEELITGTTIVERLEDHLIDELFYQEDEIGEMRHTAFMVECGLEEDPPDGPDVPPVPWGDMLIDLEKARKYDENMAMAMALSMGPQQGKTTNRSNNYNKENNSDNDNDKKSSSSSGRRRERIARSRSTDDITTLAIELTSSQASHPARRGRRASYSTPKSTTGPNTMTRPKSTSSLLMVEEPERKKKSGDSSSSTRTRTRSPKKGSPLKKSSKKNGSVSNEGDEGEHGRRAPVVRKMTTAKSGQLHGMRQNKEEGKRSGRRSSSDSGSSSKDRTKKDNPKMGRATRIVYKNGKKKTAPIDSSSTCSSTCSPSTSPKASRSRLNPNPTRLSKDKGKHDSGNSSTNSNSYEPISISFRKTVTRQPSEYVKKNALSDQEFDVLHDILDDLFFASDVEESSDSDSIITNNSNTKSRRKQSPRPEENTKNAGKQIRRTSRTSLTRKKNANKLKKAPPVRTSNSNDNSGASDRNGDRAKEKTKKKKHRKSMNDIGGDKKDSEKKKKKRSSVI